MSANKPFLKVKIKTQTHTNLKTITQIKLTCIGFYEIPYANKIKEINI